MLAVLSQAQQGNLVVSLLVHGFHIILNIAGSIVSSSLISSVSPTRESSELLLHGLLKYVKQFDLSSLVNCTHSQ